MIEDAYFAQPNSITLFQTQAWRRAWLQTWSNNLQQNNNFSKFDNIQCYSVRRSIKKLLPVKTLIPYGQGCSELKSIRSEYFYPSDASKSALDTMLAHNKSELILKDVPLAAPWLNTLKEVAAGQNQKLFQREYATGYSVNTHLDSFENYLAALGSNTRLKLFNRRKRLEKNADISIENMWPNVDEYIALLNSFHEQRWHKPCYQGDNLVFIKALLTQLHEEGHSVNLSVLKANQTPVSLLLDITVGERTYNLQGGFIEDYVKGVSLGTLHFGYAIEQAFADNDVNAYDFMAGEGKNENYKVKMANQKCEMVTLTIVRNPLLAILYALKGS